MTRYIEASFQRLRIPGEKPGKVHNPGIPKQETCWTVMALSISAHQKEKKIETNFLNLQPWNTTSNANKNIKQVEKI